MAETWSREQIEAAIAAEERKYPNIPKGLARAVAMQESYLNPNATGDNGRSLGLFQLQPAAATDAGISPALRHVPALNIQGGVKYLSQKLDQSKGDIDAALSRYNRGTPDYRGIGDPHYVQNVKRFYQPSEEKPGLLRRAANFLSPRSAEAASWYEPLPEKSAGATAPTTKPAAAPATGSADAWYEPLPEKAPAATTAPPTTSLPVEQAPAASVAPAPAQRPQPPTARSTPEQDAAYGQWATQQPVEDILSQMQRPGPAPGAPEGAPPPPTPPKPAEDKPPLISWRAAPEPPNARWWQKSLPGIPNVEIGINRDVNKPPPGQSGQQPTEPSDMVIDIEKQEPQPGSAITPESLERAQGIEPARVTVDPEELSKRWDEGGATSTDPAWWSGADPASPRHQEWLKSSPMPSTREMAREVAATGVEGAYGVLGTMAGTAIGGPPGGVAGGIALQSFGRRVTNQAGLRSQEPYIATGFGMNLYPSDVANAGFGLLAGGPTLFKAALSKTIAGKAIVQAEMSTKEAYQAWQIERQRLQAAQKSGQQAELNTALKDHATAEANYKRLVQARNDTIAANKTEYDKAVQDYGEGARQTHIEDLTAQQKYLDDLAEAQRKQYGAARPETERELLASREAGYKKTLKEIQDEQAAYETKVGAETTALESQAAAIPEAKAIPVPYAEGTPAHTLFTDMRKQHSNDPLTLEPGKASLQETRANRPKGFDGKPMPFEGQVEEIAQAFEKSTGANVATVHEQLKKLGPLTRHRDGKVRGDAKQLMGILMDVLETAPEAAAAIKAANQRWKREMSLEDMNDWLKPEHGVISVRRGKPIINPDNFLKKFNKEMEDSKLFRDSFTQEEVATIRGNMEALAAKTVPAPPLRAPVQPRPELLPGASPPPEPYGPTPPPGQTDRRLTALPGAVDDRFTKGLAEAPAPTQLPDRPVLKPDPPEVPPIYPEPTKPGQRLPAGLTVPLTPPAKVPPEPASTTVWPTGTQSDPHTGKRVRIPPPKEAWTVPQWEAYAKQELAQRPGLGRQLMSAAAGAGGMAFALQRMGVPIATVNGALFTGAGLAAGAAVGRYGDWLLSRMLLRDRYRPLLQAAVLDNGRVNPLFYNAALAALTPEDKAEYERMKRSNEAQKARR